MGKLEEVHSHFFILHISTYHLLFYVSTYD